MRLTKYDRQAFVKAVLDDTPQFDYENQAHKLVREFGITTYPEELRPFIKKYPDFFQANYVTMPSYIGNLYAKIHQDYTGSALEKHAPELWAQLVELAQLEKEQRVARNALEAKLEAVISSCSSLKIALERLPEFAKYLPQERGPSSLTNLPVANLVADLMALGWPKGAEA